MGRVKDDYLKYLPAGGPLAAGGGRRRPRVINPASALAGGPPLPPTVLTGQGNHMLLLLPRGPPVASRGGRRGHVGVGASSLNAAVAAGGAATAKKTKS